MRFFKKVGRPTDEEKMILEAIGNIIKAKGLSENDIPDCYNIDDLMTAVELIETMEVKQSKDIEQDDKESTEHSNINENEDIETQETETAETTINSNTDTSEDIDEEQELDNEPPNFEDSDYDPFADPIIERSYNKLEEDSNIKSEHQEEDELDLADSSNTPLGDLNPRTKQRVAEQTADAILKGYKNLAPEPFKWWCKFSESKIEQMTFEGEIDPSIEVEEGLTFDEYIKQTNQQINEIFEVQEETLEEIKEPLVEVLLEQELELTPQQRLGMAILSHLIQMFTMAMKLWGQNKRILEYQKHLTQLAHQAKEV